ncbi:DUF3822 family protein [Paracrocinitomix mangrovi]|uniref:DUF3822 family protein n=1 Tax=Paracrocinitomix mangrovi TaxID=2862509 RepID=UPI001C8D5862|nr:DUF3822 family protein [Paracrocinitomix mangrovi]UKN01435.1 DUF3822 family protein [Paracrocinitomix mangrovi]
MAIRKEDAYQHALCMDFQEDKFSYAILDTSSKKIVAEQTHTVDNYSRDGISPMLGEELFGFDFGSFIATAGGDRNTLIPVDLFNNSKADEIFKLNYSDPIDNLDYNRIPELGIVNIYEMPLWIKSMLVIKFPRVKIVHPSTVLLKGVFDRDNWRGRIHIYVNQGSFYLLITEKNKLQYFNRFDRTNLADMIYHTLFVLEQKEMDPAKMNVSVYGVPANWESKAEFQTYFKNPIEVSESSELGQHFILTNQLLCV